MVGWTCGEAEHHGASTCRGNGSPHHSQETKGEQEWKGPDFPFQLHTPLRPEDFLGGTPLPARFHHLPIAPWLGLWRTHSQATDWLRNTAHCTDAVSPLWLWWWGDCPAQCGDTGLYHLSLAQEQISIQNLEYGLHHVILLSHHHKDENCKLLHPKPSAIHMWLLYLPPSGHDSGVLCAFPLPRALSSHHTFMYFSLPTHSWILVW
jgi:hypothetical protein